MPATFTINIAKPVTSLEILDNYRVSGPCNLSQTGHGHADTAPAGDSEVNLDAETQALGSTESSLKQTEEVAQLCQQLNRLVDELNKFYYEVLAEHKEEIAKLSVEIARRILMQNVQEGDYKIESIVKEVLKNAPVHQELVVRLNPEDLAQCHKLQEEYPNSPFAAVKFVADPNIGRAECLLETPKGIIKSFIDEHIERISQALEKVE